jgi:predicted RNA binding protein YcfA (HicA-like mRNA interferase family)
MPLKPLSYREIKRKLEAAGFEIVSQKGSHVKFAHVILMKIKSIYREETD